LVECLAGLFGRLCYRLRSSGVEGLPAGGALIVANHLSFADPLILQMASPRPLRFTGLPATRALHPLIRWAFAAADTLEVSPDFSSGEVDRLIECLRKGEW